MPYTETMAEPAGRTLPIFLRRFLMWLSMARSVVSRKSSCTLSSSALRENTCPGRDSSFLSRRNSSGVSGSHWSCQAMRSASSSTRKPCDGVPGPTRPSARRSSALMRATTSRGLKGLHT